MWHLKVLRIKWHVIQPPAPPTAQPPTTAAPNPVPHQVYSMQLKFYSLTTNLDPTPAPPPFTPIVRVNFLLDVIQLLSSSIYS
jgi:hypothetical protein